MRFNPDYKQWNFNHYNDNKLSKSHVSSNIFIEFEVPQFFSMLSQTFSNGNTQHVFIVGPMGDFSSFNPSPDIDVKGYYHMTRIDLHVYIDMMLSWWKIQSKGFKMGYSKDGCLTFKNLNYEGEFTKFTKEESREVMINACFEDENYFVKLEGSSLKVRSYKKHIIRRGYDINFIYG